MVHPLVVEHMDVLRYALGSLYDAVISGDKLLKALYIAVGEYLHEGYGLENAARLYGPAYCKVAHFLEVGRGPVAVEIDHGADGSGAGLHEHQAGAFQVVFGGNLVVQGFPGDILVVDVEGGAYVAAVNRQGLGAVVVEHAPEVGDLGVFLALLAVEYIVELAFKANVGVAHVGAIVPDEAYGAPCELAVRINAYVLLLGDEASLEASFLEKRESRHAVIYVAVDRLAEFEVFLAVCAAVAYEFQIFICALVGEYLCELYAQGFGFLHPLGLLGCAVFIFGEFLAAHGAVHGYLVGRAGHGQQSALAVDDIAAYRLYETGPAARREGALDLGVGVEEYLDAYDLDEQEDRSHQQQYVDHIEDHPYAVAFFLIVGVGFHRLLFR